MSYPYLPADFDEKYDTGWVTVPNSLWDAQKSRGLYQEYIDQLAYADELGFDGMVLNEHHQNIYGLMPSPNLIAAALTQRTKHGKIVILGNLLPLHLNPLRVAEEYAMLDNMSDGRLIAGLRAGLGAGDVQLRRALGLLARPVLGGRRPDPPRLDRGRAVLVRGPALSAALRQSVAAADAAAASADLDSRLALARDLGADRQARLLLFPVVAQPRQAKRARSQAAVRRACSSSTATAISRSAWAS